jgi:hypothetical protein
MPNPLDNRPGGPTGEERPARQDRFLAAHAELAVLYKSAEAADVSVESHYVWLRDDPTYRARFEEADRKGIEALEARVIQRAREGLRRRVVQGGKVVMVPMRDAAGEIVLKPVLDSKGNQIEQEGKILMEPAMEELYEEVFDSRREEIVLRARHPRYENRIKADVNVTGGLAERVIAARKRVPKKEKEETTE